MRPLPAVSMRAGHESAHGHAVTAMFDRIAGRYDFMNHALSLGVDQYWRKKAAKKLLRELRQGPLLDLCAGTLDFSRLLSQAGRETVALDASAEMLAHGAHKAPSARRLMGDATQLPFEDGTFAGIVCGFGLRNVSAPKRALSEARRVLQERGRLVILEFLKPEMTQLSARLFQATFARSVIPALGAMIAGDASAYRYLSDSICSFWTEAELEQALGAAGFASVQSESLSLGIATLTVAECGGAL